MKKMINGIGYGLMFFGLFGIGGAVDLGRSTTLPILVLLLGAVLLGGTSMYEVISDEKKNSDNFAYRSNSDTRLYFLRR